MKTSDDALAIRALRETLLYELTKAMGLSQESGLGKAIQPLFTKATERFAEFPNVVKQISDMGADAIDAADDLTIAIRYPRQDPYLAAQALLKLGPDITGTTIPLLIDNLHNEKPEIRIYSLILFASLGNKASCAVGKITPLLWDSDPSVRSAATFALEKTTGRDLVESDYAVSITPSFLANSIAPDIPEGKVVEKVRNWWNEQGSKVNWHPSYGICNLSCLQKTNAQHMRARPSNGDRLCASASSVQ